MKKIAILQSNYIPWKGYFDLINSVDEFIIYDDAQYTKRDWRNRNIIKTENGLIWLSIPVEVKGKYNQSIYESVTANNKWQQKHWNSITHAYGKSPFFKKIKEPIEAFYMNNKSNSLSYINLSLIKIINNLLGIKTTILQSKDFNISNIKDPSEKLLKMCLSRSADCYVSGQAAKDYLNEQLFKCNKIKVEWFSYKNYDEYPQQYPPFQHHVSVLDLLFNTGPEAIKYLLSFK